MRASLIIFLVVGLYGQAWGSNVPRLAVQLLSYTVRAAHYRGLDAASVMGQIHQESRWNAAAHSAYADGLSQFTPETAAWIAKIAPRELGAQSEFPARDPRWAIRALCVYDRYLLDRVEQSWQSALRAYNGGLGWIRREMRAKRCKPQEMDSETCGLSLESCRLFRSVQSCAENLAYPKLILDKWAPMYRAIINPYSTGVKDE